ncbi:TRAP transporter large permease [Elioraea rosea]|uniref:TRAP transporter large permease n=1 Tax=Elioraea rosea TaxID=2492390 RepID=UPI0011825FB3|nr:TRAP transporter large permease [Elioraea rosea]
MSTLLAILFGAGLLASLPIALAMGLAGAVVLVAADIASPLIIAQRLFSGIDSFPLMAIPFFILAAELMSGGGITDLLLRFAVQAIGRVKGGLGHANILMSIFFAGISGSALADAAGPGSIIIRMMRQAGYAAPYAAAVTASSAIIAPIIPPSIIMVIYALTDNSVSVGALFMAGIVPGLLMGLALAVVNHLIAARRGYGGGQARQPWGAYLRQDWSVFPALLLPFIILGGIHGGVFTPTEASAVAVFYALFVGLAVTRTLRLAMLPAILVRTALMTSAVLLIISMASVFAWMLTSLQIPQDISRFLLSLGLPRLGLLVAIALFLLLCGLVIDTLPAVIILVPILAPVATSAGIDPLQFAMVVILNLTIGMITPPVGGVLFVITVVARIPMGQIVRAIGPFLAAHLVVLAAIILVPGLSNGLPGLLGYTR